MGDVPFEVLSMSSKLKFEAASAVAAETAELLKAHRRAFESAKMHTPFPKSIEYFQRQIKVWISNHCLIQTSISPYYYSYRTLKSSSTKERRQLLSR